MLSQLKPGYTYLLLQNMAGKAGGGEAGKGVTKAAWLARGTENPFTPWWKLQSCHPLSHKCNVAATGQTCFRVTIMILPYISSQISTRVTCRVGLIFGRGHNMPFKMENYKDMLFEDTLPVCCLLAVSGQAFQVNQVPFRKLKFPPLSLKLYQP